MIQLALILCALGCLFLGGVVLLRDIANRRNQLFAGISICFMIWIIAILLFLNTQTLGHAFIYAKLFYASAALFPALFIAFAFIHPQGTKLSWRKAFFILLGSASIVLPLIFVNNFVISEVVISSTNYVIIDRFSYIIYALYFVFYFSIGMFIALRKALTEKASKRWPASLYAIGILINSVFGFTTNLIFPYFGDFSLIWVGPIASIFFLGLTTYSIIKHHMFDIRLIIARTAGYTLLLLSILVAYGLLLFTTSRFLFNEGSVSTVQLVINLILAIFLAVTYQPLKGFFDKTTDKIFFKNSYNLQAALNRISDITTEETKLKRLIARTEKVLLETIKPRDVSFIILNDNGEVVIATGPYTKKTRLEELRALTDTNHIVDSANENKGEVPYALIARLHTSTQIVGYMICDEKKSGEIYRESDRQLIQVAVDAISVAIQNALRFEEIRTFNETLQSRVNSATSELQETNKKLHELDQSKDEFISMASHQLRTPLTTVKGYISMLLDGDVGKITPQQRKVLEEAFNSSQRMVYLIGDFLNVSRLQTGKFELELHKVDFSELIEQEVSQMQDSALSRNIRISYLRPQNVPTMSIDENKIRQVIMNFLDNALYYSRPGSEIEVSLIKHNNHVSLRVKDHGIGVPNAERHHLFTKFFRASNAKKQRPDGTGIGLFMARKVVVAHGGTIIFETQEGKGSTFGFRLPLESLKN